MHESLGFLAALSVVSLMNDAKREKVIILTVWIQTLIFFGY